MIRSVHLERFKCFTDEKIQFGKLSVLAGTNGAGKSSVIQSLLLFAQTIKQNPFSKNLFLNGEFVNLGYFEDVVNQNSRKDDGFKIGFQFASEKIGHDDMFSLSDENEPPHNKLLSKFDKRRNFVDSVWHFLPNNKNNTIAQINDINIVSSYFSLKPLLELYSAIIPSLSQYTDHTEIDEIIEKTIKESKTSFHHSCYKEAFDFQKLIPVTPIPHVDEFEPEYEISDYVINKYIRKIIKLNKIYYISAERMGPREVYDTTKCEEEIWVGHKGQYVAQYIHENASKRMNDKLYRKGVFNNSLLNLTNYWLSEIISDSEINIEKILKTNLFTLSFRQNSRADFLRPSNCAFGLSYTLPIIVACLSIGEDQTLIIENPEAHLHPTAQSRMGEFLALTASTGANVIIETHSDHVLNGIRKAVYSKVLDPEEVCITFFSKEKNGSIRLQSPEIDEKGKISEWPKGFFDQFELDLSFLMGYKDESIS